MVGRLVEQQQVGVAGQRARQRGARQLAAGERLQARSRCASRKPSPWSIALTPSRQLYPPACSSRACARGVGVERRLVGGAAGHRLLELGEVRLERDQLGAALEHVVAQRQVALARRALVVQRDAHVLGQHELAAVDERLARQHPQQRRLARAVAARTASGGRGARA